MKIFFYLFVSWALWLSPASANEWQFAFSEGVKSFQYREYDRNNERLLSEEGTLLNIDLSLQYHKPRYYFSSRVDYGIGTVNYDGHTQSRKTLKAKTKIELITFFGEAGWYIEPNIAIFTRFSQNRMYRTVLATNTTSSFTSNYTWNEFGFGTRLNARVNPTQSINSYFLFSKTQDPKVSITAPSENISNLELSLGSKSTVEFGINWLYQDSDKYIVDVGAKYQQYSFGASNSVGIGSSRSIYEPRSRTKLLDLEISLIFPLN